MADDDKKSTRSELAQAVRELRDEVARLRAEQATHACHGHGCGHAHCNWGHCGCWVFHAYSYQVPGCAPYPTWVVTSGNLNITSSGDAGYSGPVFSVTGATASAPQVVTFGSVN